MDFGISLWKKISAAIFFDIDEQWQFQPNQTVILKYTKKINLI